MSPGRLALSSLVRACEGTTLGSLRTRRPRWHRRLPPPHRPLSPCELELLFGGCDPQRPTGALAVLVERAIPAFVWMPRHAGRVHRIFATEWMARNRATVRGLVPSGDRAMFAAGRTTSQALRTA